PSPDVAAATRHRYPDESVPGSHNHRSAHALSSAQGYILLPRAVLSGWRFENVHPTPGYPAGSGSVFVPPPMTSRRLPAPDNFAAPHRYRVLKTGLLSPGCHVRNADTL